MEPLPVSVQTDELDWLSAGGGAVASLAAVVGLVVAILDARRSRRVADKAETALSDERKARQRELDDMDAARRAEEQAAKLTVGTSWLLGPYDDGKGTVSLTIRNNSAQGFTNIDVFAVPPLVFFSDRPDDRESRTAFETPLSLRATHSIEGTKFELAKVARDTPGYEDGWDPPVEAYFTDWLGNKWHLDARKRLTLTQRAVPAVRYEPNQNLPDDWRTRPK
ncbi:hypothetical protein [Rhodococcoides kroppenstedtii]|uniref:hypothetical protein n=1 Tax=Rhodococcoides kroppenstedtii TaxID=293050 RepID=UPI0028E7F632|nr:hypothetical protein [Rhodococcus kroppenstedtii]